MTRIARLLAILVISACIISLGTLSIGAVAPHQADSESSNPPAAEAESETSVRCLPFGLYGAITAEALVDRLSDSSDNLTFVGTSNGLYVVGPDGKLRHFLYSPFGTKHVVLIDDITGDGSREVVVVLNDTQVPALRCYDGITWEKLWQFAPLTKIWDRMWVKRQMGITDLQVIGNGDSQSVVVTSGRCVFSVDARDGKVNWRYGASGDVTQMTTVADLNGDDTDEVFVGSDDGHFYLLDGKTGEVRWRTKLPSRLVHGEVTQSAAQHVLTLDREAGQVAVASTDGLVRLFDLKDEELEWEVSLPTQDGNSAGPMTLVPNATSDGQPGILISYPSGTENKVALLDATGGKLWDKDIGVSSLELGSLGGKRVIIVATAEEIKLLDLADGETVVKTIPMSTLDGQAPMVRQVGETSFLLTSSTSDLSVVSASGDTLWNYPRVTNVKAKGGSFVGDGTPDVLFCGEWSSNNQYGYSPTTTKTDGGITVYVGTVNAQQVSEPETRLLNVMDGATGKIAWSYEVPFSELSTVGGLKGIAATADLVGNDNVPDIIGYCEDTVFIFSGNNGVLLPPFPVGQPIASLDVIRNGVSGNAIAITVAGGLMIFDTTGTPLWTTTSADLIGDESGSFMMLDDVNFDNVSDLAIISAAKMVVLKSVAATDNYQLHQTFKADANYYISYAKIVPDADKDGVRDLACIQRAQEKQQPGGQYVQSPNPLLSQRSLVDGKELFKVELPAYWPAYDLACGDFDGDGYADSLFSSSSDGGPGLRLWVLSGKDGAILQMHPIKTNVYGSPGGGKPPAINTGDVNGDGADDLVSSVDPRVNGYPDYHEKIQLGLEVYSVAQNAALDSIPITPPLKGNMAGYGYGDSVTALKPYVDADNRMEVIAGIVEPWIPSYDPDNYEGNDPNSSSYFAVVNIAGGQRLAAFMGFNPASISLFETHQSGVLGAAASGGAYFLDVNAHLHVTSPEDGAKTGPSVGVRWEGPTDGDFSQVFVDGVRNDITNGFESELYLGRGQHDIVVRSVDDYGRISYGPSDLSAPVSIKVTPSPWKPVLLVLSLFVLLAAILLLFYARLHRVWRARRRAAKP